MSKKDAPTYVCVGTNDGIANWRTMQSRLEGLEALGILQPLPPGAGEGFSLNAEELSEIHRAGLTFPVVCEMDMGYKNLLQNFEGDILSRL